MSRSNVLTSIASVVVNYNAGSLLRDCVESWFKFQPDSPMVIVDNASTDNSLELVSSLSCDYPISVIKNASNSGFSTAANQGIKSINTRCVLLLNPDCVLTTGAVNKMAAVLDNDPQVAAAGPQLLNTDGSEQAGGRRAIPTPWRSLVRVFGLSRLRHRYPRLFSDFLLHTDLIPDKPVEVEALSGACMLIRREALEDVGLLDEGYFMHCEDLDWCMRFRQRSWKLLFVPDAKVIHDKGACSRNCPIFVEWHKHKGMMRFYRKFFRHQYPGVLMWLVGIAVWLRFCSLAIYYTGSRFAFWAR